MKKTRFAVWMGLGTITWGLVTHFSDKTIRLLQVMGLPVTAYHDVLRALSQEANGLAWVLYLFVSSLPLVIVFCFSRTKDKPLLAVGGLMSLFLIMATYGALNHFFIHPDFVRLGQIGREFQIFIDSIIALILVLFGLMMGVMRLRHTHGKWLLNETMIHLLLHGLSFGLGMWFMARLSVYFEGEGLDILVICIATIFDGIRALLAISLSYDVYQTVLKYRQIGLSETLVERVSKISKTALDLLSLSVAGTLVVFSLQFFLMAGMVDATFVFAFPFLEITFAIGMWLGSKILLRAYELDLETKQFI